MQRAGGLITTLLMCALLAPTSCGGAGKNINSLYIFDHDHGVMYLRVRTLKDGTLPTLWLTSDNGRLEKLSSLVPLAKEARFVQEMEAGQWCILRYEGDSLEVPSPCQLGQAVRLEVYAGTVTYVGRLDLTVVQNGPSGQEFSLDIVDEGEEARAWFAKEYPRFIDKYYSAPMQYRDPGPRVVEKPRSP